MTEPLIRRLAARGEQLTVGALPWVAPVYRAMPQVAEVIDLPFAHGGLQWSARRRLAREWRGRFDVAYVLPNSLKSALLPWMAGIPSRVGYHGESRWGFLNQRLANPAKSHRPPMVAFYSALSGEPSAPGERPHLQLAPAEVQTVLAQQGLSLGAYDVFVHGAEYGPAKRWPASHFAELARRLPGPVLLLGAAKEQALGDEIVALATGADCRNLAGRTRLLEAFALIAGARRVVTNDTGLMHVAAAMDKPQVALFGSSSPEHTPPLSPEARILWLKQAADYQPALDCAPCFERICPLGHMRCLQDLAVDRVQAALQQL